MEALETGDQMSNWNDDRLDHLDRRVDEGFARVKGQIVRLEDKMNEGFAEMRSAYAALTRTLLVSTVAIVVALLGIVGALFT